MLDVVRLPDIVRMANAVDNLTRALVNLEGDTLRPKIPDGWKVITPKHPERVMGDVVQQVAWPRFLVWWLYLQSQRPTRASFERAAHRIRGHLIWRLALRMQREGKPLPVKSNVKVPERMLRAPIVARAADDFDPADWWDEFGQIEAEEAYLPLLSQAEKAQIVADVAESLQMQQWFGAEADAMMMQSLETYWAQLAGQMAGLQFQEAAGITGAFNIYDQRFYDYLLKNTGALVTKIDQTTREQLSWELYKLLGGTPDQAPLAMNQLAPKLLQAMWDTYDNALAKMSLKRAMMIALTETARAEEFGNFVSMLQAGVMRKIWIVSAGACMLCIVNAEQGPIPILDEFPSGHMTPPLHPRCRCSAAASLESSYNPSQWQPNMELVDRLMSDPDIAFWPQMPVSLRMQVPWTNRLDLSQKRINQIGKAAAALSESVGTEIGIEPQHGMDDVVAQFQKTRPLDSSLKVNERKAVERFQWAVHEAWK